MDIDIDKLVSAPVALRRAADAIEQRTIAYAWSHAGCCNCGIVAQFVTGLSCMEVYEAAVMPDMNFRAANGEGYVWSFASDLNCPVTKLPMTDIIRILWESGLPPKAIGQLEFLSDPVVRERAGLRVIKWHQDKSSRSCVVRYMRALADIIDERGALPARTAREAELVGA